MKKIGIFQAYRAYLKEHPILPYLLLSFILPVFVMLFVFVSLQLYPFGEKTLMSGDYVLQYVPIYRALGSLVKDWDFGSLYWSWHKGMGGVMTTVWGFNSFSILSLVIGLVPTGWLNMTIFLVTLLRHGLAGWSFYYLLYRRYQAAKHPVLALVVAVTYSLNGYLIVNQINPNFLDNLILFPLLIIGVEKILDGKGSFKYSILLALLIVTQFYTAYMGCIFIMLYGCYYAFLKSTSWQCKIKGLLRLLAYSLLGVGLSAIWLLPVFYGLLDSKVASAQAISWMTNFVYNPLQIFLKFITGSASGNEWGDYSSLPNFYVGVIGFLGTCLYFLNGKIGKRQKIGTGLFVLFLLLAFSNTFLIRLWHMGQLPVGFFHRNAWLLSIFFSLITYQSLAKLDNISKKQVAYLALAIGLLAVWGLVARKQFTYDLVTDGQLYFWLAAAIGLVVLLYYKQKKSYIIWCVLLITLLDMGINAKIIIERNLWFTEASLYKIDEFYQAAFDDLNVDQSDLSRLEMPNVFSWNSSLDYNYAGLTHFTSSIEYRNLEFLGKLGLSSSLSVFQYDHGTPLTDALLNLRYYVTFGSQSDNDWVSSSRSYMPSYYTEVTNASFSHLYENSSVLGLGFSGDSELTQLVLDSKNPVANQNQIYQGLFGGEDILTPVDSTDYTIEYQNAEMVEENGRQLIRRTSSDESGWVTIRMTPQDANSYYLSVPYLSQLQFPNVTLSSNNGAFGFFDRYRHPQLWNVFSDVAGEEQYIMMELKNDNSIDITGLEIYRFDDERFRLNLESGNLASWRPSQVSSTLIVGQVEQVADKNYLFTSIPYNKGWQVEVDGEPVEGEMVWGALLAFPLSPGKHTIRLHFVAPGFILGAGISSISAAIMIVGYGLSRMKKKRSVSA